MEARVLRAAGVKSRARRASTVGLLLTLFASAAHAQGTAEQRRVCTPDVYRLCIGEIPMSVPTPPAWAVTAQA